MAVVQLRAVAAILIKMSHVEYDSLSRDMLTLANEIDKGILSIYVYTRYYDWVYAFFHVLSVFDKALCLIFDHIACADRYN